MNGICVLCVVITVQIYFVSKIAMGKIHKWKYRDFAIHILNIFGK